MRTKAIAILSLTCFFGLASCRQTEKTEAVTAGIEAAQMEGRNTARQYLNRQWTDSTERQADMARVDSIAATYKDPESAAAFTKSFRSTLKVVRPDLHQKLVEAEEDR